MSFSYNKLWKLLIDKNLNKTQLKENIGISSSTLSKLSKNENVNLSIVDKICNYLQCDIGDIVEHIDDSN